MFRLLVISSALKSTLSLSKTKVNLYRLMLERLLYSTRRLSFFQELLSATGKPNRCSLEIEITAAVREFFTWFCHLLKYLTWRDLCRCLPKQDTLPNGSPDELTLAINAIFFIYQVKDSNINVKKKYMSVKGGCYCDFLLRSLKIIICKNGFCQK